MANFSIWTDSGFASMEVSQGLTNEACLPIILLMRLDKTAFKKQSMVDAADHQRHYRAMSEEEKARSFRYLMSLAYGMVDGKWPRMDKSLVQIRKRS